MVKTILEVAGMACGMCESHINAAIREHFAVKKVTASRKSGSVTILSELPQDAAALKQTVEQLGYSVGEIRTEVLEEKRGFFRR